MIACYDWPGGREAMLRFGPETGPIVIAALPLFEEANRTRTFVVTILRALANLGVGAVLPDFPGTGESLIPTAAATLAAMRAAYTALTALLQREARPIFALGIRSGALLDAFAMLDGRWHLASQDGPNLLRNLDRLRVLGSQDHEDGSVPIEIAGNLVSREFLSEISHASPSGERLRVARMAQDPQPADIRFDGAALWRRSEPGNDPLLAEQLAGDIAAWIATCAA